VRINPESGTAQTHQHFGVRPERQPLSLADPISKEVQGPAGRHLRVQLAQRPGGRIAAIGEQSLPGGKPLPVQPVKGPAGHKYFPPHLEIGRQNFRLPEYQRNGPNRPHIRRDIFADFAIAPRRCPTQAAVFINQVDRQPVYLQFYDIFQFVADGGTHPIVKGPQFAGGKYIPQTQQWRSMGDFLKTGQRLPTDPLRR